MKTTNRLENRKLEPLGVEAFAGLDEAGRHLFMQRAVQSTPGLAYELSITLPPHLPLAQAYDRYSFGAGKARGAFAEALSSGHLALARLWAAKHRARPQSVERWGKPTHPEWSEALGLLRDGVASDLQIWRAKGWLLKACAKGAGPVGAQKGAGEPEQPLGLNAQEVAREAVASFCAGRPLLGALWAQQLLGMAPMEIARATAAPAGLSPHLTPSMWEKSGGERKAFAMNFNETKPPDSHSAWSPRASDATLLEHLEYWGAALAQTDPELCARIKGLDDALWERGAFACAERHARRFVAKPYGADDPRAIIATDAALAMAGLPSPEAPERQASTHAHQTFFATLLARCAALPDQDPHAKDGKAWDAFVAAHPNAPQASPDPFKVSGSSCAALLSLAGDARLIEMGLERGFSSQPAHWALTESGRSIWMFVEGKAPWPRLVSKPFQGTFCVLPQGCAMAPSEGTRHEGMRFEEKLGSAVKKSKKDFPQPEPKHPFEGWIFQSLASLALVCGHARTARLLVRSGCPEGSFAQALVEASRSNRAEVERLSSQAETEALFEASGGLDGAPASARKTLRV
jgi:hypothetical protein